jgi:LPXTG-motif cell wall-anchored protein
MRRLLTILMIACLLLALPVAAEEGNVVYDGETQSFVFAPGSEESLTDLFPEFKDVMPGDRLQQTITVKNDASNQVKVEIFVRSLGAQEGSEAFLSQLKLQVALSQENEMGYMFDAYAHEPAQMEDWVCLGMLYSGGEVNLDLTLDVPVEMGNEFQDAVGYLDWEFKVIEYPVEPTDPEPPKTGDDSMILPALAVMGCSGLVVLFLLLRNRKEESANG